MKTTELTDLQLEIIETLKSVYHFAELNEKGNLVFHEIFENVPDPDYVCEIEIQNDYVFVDFVVGPKTDFFYKELLHATEDWDLDDFKNHIKKIKGFREF